MKQGGLIWYLAIPGWEGMGMSGHLDVANTSLHSIMHMCIQCRKIGIRKIFASESLRKMGKVEFLEGKN